MKNLFVFALTVVLAGALAFSIQNPNHVEPVDHVVEVLVDTGDVSAQHFMESSRLLVPEELTPFLYQEGEVKLLSQAIRRDAVTVNREAQDLTLIHFGYAHRQPFKRARDAVREELLKDQAA